MLGVLQWPAKTAPTVRVIGWIEIYICYIYI